MRPRITAPLLAALLVACAPALVGCKTNPATGRSQLQALSRSQEIAIGDQAKGELTEEYGGAVADAVAREYVREVGMKLVAGVEKQYADLPWEFTLLDSDVINAFALPGGKVFITRGLARLLRDEAQLAGVLGHEIGHVTARHINDRVARQMGFAIGAAVIGVATDSDAARAGAAVLIGAGGVYMLTFDRNEEIESDTLGMRYMERAGYDPRGQLEVMEVLAEAAKGARPPEFLSTHPHPETRIDRIERELRRRYAHTQNNPEFQRFPDRYRQRLLDRLPAASKQ